MYSIAAVGSPGKSTGLDSSLVNKDSEVSVFPVDLCQGFVFV